MRQCKNSSRSLIELATLLSFSTSPRPLAHSPARIAALCHEPRRHSHAPCPHLPSVSHRRPRPRRSTPRCRQRCCCTRCTTRRHTSVGHAASPLRHMSLQRGMYLGHIFHHFHLPSLPHWLKHDHHVIHIPYHHSRQGPCSSSITTPCIARSWCVQECRAPRCLTAAPTCATRRLTTRGAE